MQIATLDLETDPFLHGRVPIPFAAGIYDGENYHDFWGKDCIAQMLDFLKNYPGKLLIYAHNGGKFDYWYLSHALSDPIMLIDSRIVKASLYHHEIRDSLIGCLTFFLTN